MIIDVPSGQKLQFRMLDPEYYDKDGNMCIKAKDLEWEDCPDGMIKAIPDDCNHRETICMICIESWCTDWEFRLVQI